MLFCFCLQRHQLTKATIPSQLDDFHKGSLYDTMICLLQTQTCFSALAAARHLTPSHPLLSQDMAPGKLYHRLGFPQFPLSPLMPALCPRNLHWNAVCVVLSAPLILQWQNPKALLVKHSDNSHRTKKIQFKENQCRLSTSKCPFLHKLIYQICDRCLQNFIAVIQMYRETKCCSIPCMLKKFELFDTFVFIHQSGVDGLMFLRLLIV